MHPAGVKKPSATKSGYGVNTEIADPHSEKAGDKRLPRGKDVFVTQDRSADDRGIFVNGHNEKEAKKNQFSFTPTHLVLQLTARRQVADALLVNCLPI